ncbi:MAG: hypothetical protein KJ645_13810 [Planctomycetes bacterium]|nr:hypothetical protein [Planctomycetota bacterium]
MNNRIKKEESFSFLLGVGLDNDDGHIRITKGEDFHLVGGSEKTHHKMQDKMLEVSDDLAKKGKKIRDIGPEDFKRLSDIIRE